MFRPRHIRMKHSILMFRALPVQIRMSNPEK
nr:MAG TPA: hypothetical protein [Caudoviricetes sp.]